MKHLGGCLLLMLLLAGCAAAPVQEMADARQAYRAAVEAGARDYNTPPLAQAKKSLDAAEVNLDLGDYKTARMRAIEARNNALVARQIAVAIQAARQAIAEAQQAGRNVAPAQQALKAAETAAASSDADAVSAETQRAISLAGGT